MNKMQKHNRRGIALMFVMIAVLVTGSMAVAYFGSRDNSIAISSNIETATQARIAAETGVDLAIAILETDADWRTNHIDGVVLSDYMFGKSKLTIYVLDSETNLPPTENSNNINIDILSTVADTTQKILLSATVIPNEEYFDIDFSEYAIFARNSILIEDASTLNRWATSPSASQNTPLKLGTLSSKPLAIKLNNKDIQSIEIHAPKIASSMVSTTGLSYKFEENPKLLNPPATAPDAIDISSKKDWQNSHSTSDVDWQDDFFNNKTFDYTSAGSYFSIENGAYKMETLQLEPGEHLRISGNVQIEISNDLELDNANIILEESATLELHIGGNLNLNASYIGNKNESISNWSNPSAIALYGENEKNWNIGNGSTIKGEMYAPNSNITIEQSTLCGRVAAHEVVLKNESKLLYDQILDSGGYGNRNSSLYEEDGSFVPELKGLNTLDPEMIQILETKYSSASNAENPFSNDWRNSPTKRIHDVIYSFTVYGIDAKNWESYSNDRTNQFVTKELK